jgi:hypothetical protein
MGQPTQKSPSVCKTRVSDTLLKTSDANSLRGRLSISARHDVECLPDRARQPGTTTTDFPRARVCPMPPRGLLMSREGYQKKLEGRPETVISAAPLAA